MPTSVRAGLQYIDLHFQGQPGVIAAYLLESTGEYALIETGPGSTLPALLAGLEAAGVPMEAVSKLLVTHIHLDHAGAAGTLIRRYPHLQLYVHEIGAPHMADPAKLLASATRIYGDRMDSLWGKFEPVPASNMHVLTHGDQITVGDLKLTAVYTPGHASHHLAFHNPRHDEVFSGDVAAVRLQGFDYVRPPTPPPDIDLPLWTRSLAELRALRPQTLLLTHFGPFSDVPEHLDRVKTQLSVWATTVERALDKGLDVADIKRSLKAQADGEVDEVSGPPGTAERYELATPSGMSADGLLRYFRKREPRSG